MMSTSSGGSASRADSRGVPSARSSSGSRMLIAFGVSSSRESMRSSRMLLAESSTSGTYSVRSGSDSTASSSGAVSTSLSLFAAT